MAGSEVSKPVFITAIVAAVLFVGVLAYHFVIPHKPSMPESARQKYMDHTRTTPTTYTQPHQWSPVNNPTSAGGAYGVYQQNGGGPSSSQPGSPN
jgi:hypothetical protein